MIKRDSGELCVAASLKVSKVDRTEYPCVEVVAACWEEYAKKLNKPSWSRKCEDSQFICSYIHNELSVGKISDAFEVYVCRNQHNNTLGIMMLEVSGSCYKNSVYVYMLATRPDNICPSVKSSVRGVGCFLLQYAEDRAKSLRVDEAALVTTYSSREFYLKRGFWNDGHSLALRKRVFP